MLARSYRVPDGFQPKRGRISFQAERWMNDSAVAREEKSLGLLLCQRSAPLLWPGCPLNASAGLPKRSMQALDRQFRERFGAIQPEPPALQVLHALAGLSEKAVQLLHRLFRLRFFPVQLLHSPSGLSKNAVLVLH